MIIDDSQNIHHLQTKKMTTLLPNELIIKLGILIYKYNNKEFTYNKHI